MERNITKQEIVSLISKKKVLILDIGSYDGTDSALIASHFDDAEVHCFECDPRNIKLWKSKGWPEYMKLYECAVGAGKQRANFYVSHGRKNNSGSLRTPKSHKELFSDVSFDTVARVPVITLDYWYKHLSRVIDLAWIDVNGAEGDVVKGGIDTLTYYTRYLHIEFSDKELYEGQVSKAELIAMLPSFEVLEEYGFQGNFGNLLLKNKNL